jgi:hypothetical protein
LTRFSVDDLVDVSALVREMAAGATTMLDVAQQITDHLFARLVDEDGHPGCVSVRIYKTHRVDRLPEDLAETARIVAGGPVPAGVQALVLLGSTDEPGRMPALQPTDRVRPLTPEALEDQGLLTRLIESLGLDLGLALDPDAARDRQLHRQTYDVFLLPDVLASEWVTDENRPVVEQLGLRSLLALGGVLLSGELFFLVLFTTVTVPERTADLLRSFAPAVQAALTPFVLYKVFSPDR